MTAIAIIPARGGSKRIPGKNIKSFCGKPMIAYPIEAARKSRLFDRIVVSTDSTEVAKVARDYDAETPFMRPMELSDDHTPTRPVVIHAINMVAGKNELPDFVCSIYATAPFIQAQDLKKAFEVLIETQCEFVFSVSKFGSPIQRALKLTKKGRIEMFSPQYFKTRSQDLEDAYHDAGQFYFGRTEAFLNDVPTFSEASVPFIMPSYRVQDIDTMEDWRRAELLFMLLQRESVRGTQ